VRWGRRRRRLRARTGQRRRRRRWACPKAGAPGARWGPRRRARTCQRRRRDGKPGRRRRRTWACRRRWPRWGPAGARGTMRIGQRSVAAGRGGGRPRKAASSSISFELRCGSRPTLCIIITPTIPTVAVTDGHWGLQRAAGGGGTEVNSGRLLLKPMQRRAVAAAGRSRLRGQRIEGCIKLQPGGCGVVGGGCAVSGAATGLLASRAADLEERGGARRWS
jgi:hypothetical protein